MRKKVLKVAGVALLIVALVLTAIGVYLLSGMNEMKAMAIGEINLSVVEDGLYEGAFDLGNRWSNVVSIRVKDHRIEQIDLIESQTFELQEIAQELFEQVLDAQSLDVDMVSGATISSIGYLKAIENAFE